MEIAASSIPRVVWQSIELRELRVFLTLAEELHFGRTAERLHMTPSRVSQLIRELESKVGATLVHRTSRRVSLTTAGTRFLSDVGGVYEELLAVLERNHVPSGSPDGVVRIGLLTPPSGGPHLPAIVEVFEARHSQCRVEIVEVDVDDPFGGLHSGQLDVMATWLPHGQPELVVGPVLTAQPRVLAVGRGHPLADRESVSVEDIADYPVPYVRGLTELLIPPRTPSGRPIQRRRLTPRRGRYDRSQVNTELAYLVARGAVVHPTVPAVAAYWGHPEISYVPILDLPPLKAALVWPRRSDDPRVRALVGVAREVLADRYSDPPPGTSAGAAADARSEPHSPARRSAVH